MSGPAIFPAVEGPLLSREEMSSLLQGEGQGAAPGLTPLTLGAPPPLSRDEEQVLAARLRDAMRQIGHQLGTMIHKEAGAEIASARRRRFGDLAASLSDLTAAVVGPSSAPGSAGLVLTLPMDEALEAVDMLLGGSGSPRETKSSAPTRLESALILELAGAIAQGLAGADPAGASRWKVETLVVDRDAVPALAAHDTAVVVDLKLSMGEKALVTSVWIPESWISAAGMQHRRGRGEAREEGLLALPVLASARFDAGWLKLGDALLLRPDDVVLLEPAPDAKLYLNGVPAFSGTILRDTELNLFEVGAAVIGESHDGSQSHT